MKTNRERSLISQRGNALIYVLIAIALFAALSMTLGRQGDTGEAGALPAEKAELYADQMIAYAAQAKSAVDQMLFTGTRIDDLDFTPPTAGGFNTPPHAAKVYHPEGGGLVPGRINEEAIAEQDSDPAAGWYLGRFNNVEWTATAGEDVILAAYQIARPVCERINMKITGTTAIPAMGAAIKAVMIDDDSYGAGANADLTTDPAGSPACTDCHKRASLCVEAGGMYAFYTVIADQ